MQTSYAQKYLYPSVLNANKQFLLGTSFFKHTNWHGMVSHAWYFAYVLHNEKCIDYNKTGLNNIGPRGKYGKNKDRNLFGCRTCGKRFAETHNTAYFGLHCSQDLIRQIVHHAAEGVSVRATAILLSCDKNKINRVILKAGEHIMLVLSYLLRSLHMTEVQLDGDVLI